MLKAELVFQKNSEKDSDYVVTCLHSSNEFSEAFSGNASNENHINQANRDGLTLLLGLFDEQLEMASGQLKFIGDETCKNMPDKLEPWMHLTVHPYQAVTTASSSLSLLTPCQHVKFKTELWLEAKTKSFFVGVDHAILCVSIVVS